MAGNIFTKMYDSLVQKLNPAQAAISRSEPIATPENNISWVTAYEEIEVVRRCVEMIINGVMEVPFKVESATPTRGAVAKVNKLLNNRPNPFEDRVRLFRRAVLDFLLDGNIFFYYDAKGGFMYVLPAKSVEIVTDEKTLVKEYVFTSVSMVDEATFYSPTGYIPAGGSPTRRQSTKTEGAIRFSPNEIIHVKDDNAGSMFRGRSRLASINNILVIYDALLDFQRQFFENNAVPGLVLKTENALNDKVKKRLLEEWHQNFTSVFNGVRNPAILDNGLSIDRFSEFNFQSLDFESSVDRLQQDISKSLGVPYVLLKTGNTTVIEKNQILFYEHTVLPIVAQISSAFNLFWPELLITPDTAVVKALQPDLRIQSQHYSTLVNAGIITPNEAREKMNFPKSDEADMDNIRIPQNITGSATNPGTGGRPSNSDTNNIPADSAGSGGKK